MLNTVPELTENLVRHVIRELGAEVHSNALGTDNPHDLLHPLAQHGRGIVKKQMGLIEEKNELGFVEVTHLWQVLEQFRQEPQEKARIQPWLQDELVCHKNIDDTSATEVGTHEIIQFQGGLAKQSLSTFALQR